LSPAGGGATIQHLGVRAHGAFRRNRAVRVGRHAVGMERRRIRQMTSTHSSVVKASATTSKQTAAYAKPKLHATERALYEMDARQALPEADGVEKLADGELEDKEASGVARERMDWGELPTGGKEQC